MEAGVSGKRVLRKGRSKYTDSKVQNQSIPFEALVIRFSLISLQSLETFNI